MRDFEVSQAVIPDFTIEQAFGFITALRCCTDGAVFIEPYGHEIWAFNASGAFEKTAEDLLHDGQGQDSLSLTSVSQGRTLIKYDKGSNGFFKVRCTPLKIDGRPFALETWSVFGDEMQYALDASLLAEQEKNLEIISILASEYSSVYYIDLTTDELTPYTMNEETETTFGSVFRSGITYSEAYKLYVDKLILLSWQRKLI